MGKLQEIIEKKLKADFAGKSIDDLSAAELQKLHADSNEQFLKELILEEKAAQDKMNQEAKAANDELLAKISKKLDELEKKAAAPAADAQNSSPALLKSAISSLVAEIKEKGNSGFFARKELQLKDVGTMTTGSQTGASGVPKLPLPMLLPGLEDVPRREIILLSRLNQAPTSSSTIQYAYKADQEGTAGGTAEGVKKNQIHFAWVNAQVTVKKRTAFIKVSTEALDDVEFLESEIYNELIAELLLDAERQTFNGDGLSQNFLGIYTTAAAFAAGSFADTVEAPNEVDVLVVAMNQIKVANQPRPNFILVNPTDLTKLKLRKNDKKDYVNRLIFVADTLTLDGVPIFETTLVPVDNFLVGSFDKATIYTKKALAVEMGYDSDDFTKNLVTIRAEWRGAVLVKKNSETAFVKGVFSTAIAALEVPPPGPE